MRFLGWREIVWRFVVSLTCMLMYDMMIVVMMHILYSLVFSLLVINLDLRFPAIHELTI